MLVWRLSKRVDQALIPISTLKSFQLSFQNGKHGFLMQYLIKKSLESEYILYVS